MPPAVKAGKATKAKVAEPPVDVAGLLKRSRAAHDTMRVIDRRNEAGRVEQMKHAADDALHLRMLAHEADPGHVNPEWLNDKAPHAEIVAYYERYIRGH